MLSKKTRRLIKRGVELRSSSLKEYVMKLVLRRLDYLKTGSYFRLCYCYETAKKNLVKRSFISKKITHFVILSREI